MYFGEHHFQAARNKTDGTPWAREHMKWKVEGPIIMKLDTCILIYVEPSEC